MVVTGTFNDGHSEDVTSQCTTSPTTEQALTKDDKEVTVTCGSCTAKFEITVNPVAVDNFIKLAATEETTMTWTKGMDGSSLQYSFTGNDDDWTAATSGTAVTFGKDADKMNLYLKGTLVNNSNNSGSNKIAINCADSSQPTVVLSGSLMNLLLDSEGKPATTLPELAFGSLFSNSDALKKIDETKDKLLPATVTTPNCYSSMFSGCINLINAPELPAKQLTDSCYYYMFGGCTSLTDIKPLPAEELATWCYASMFMGCTSLKQIPEISATKLANYACNAMFSGCNCLRISNSVPSQGAKFFKCPDTSDLTNPVKDMFKNTIGSYTSDPVTNGEYYYDITPERFEDTNWYLIIDAVNKFEKSNQDETAMKELCATFSDVNYSSEGTTVEEHLKNFIGKEHGAGYVTRIIGINHDTLKQKIGSTEKATFTFDLVELLQDEDYNTLTSTWNAESKKSNADYTTSSLKNNLTGEYEWRGLDDNVYNLITQWAPQLKGNIKTITKSYRKYNGSSWVDATYDEMLFPLSATEVNLSSKSGEGSVYKYWSQFDPAVSTDPWIKRDYDDNKYSYWLASVNEDTTDEAYVVNTSGKLVSSGVQYQCAPSFAFCI